MDKSKVALFWPTLYINIFVSQLFKKWLRYDRYGLAPVGKLWGPMHKICKDFEREHKFFWNLWPLLAYEPKNANNSYAASRVVSIAGATENARLENGGQKSMRPGIFHQHGHWSNLAVKNLDADSFVLLQLMQLLSWGHGPSSGSTLSPSAVQQSGTRFLPTSGTLT